MKGLHDDTSVAAETLGIKVLPLTVGGCRCAAWYWQVVFVQRELHIYLCSFPCSHNLPTSRTCTHCCHAGFMTL